MQDVKHVIVYCILLVFIQVCAKQFQFDCQRVAWFMGISWQPSNLRFNYIKFAILSAQQHAPMLQPVLIFLHPDEPSKEYFEWMNWFHDNNVIICNATEDAFLLSELKKYGENNQMLRGTQDPRNKYPIFFRMDIDYYFEKCISNLEDVYQKHVLYTDTDVGIVKEINSCNLPKSEVLHIGAEHQLGKIRNTGVLVINVQNYAKYKNEFAEFLRDKWDKFENDQPMINAFFHFQKDKVQFLPHEFNYKMYWEGLELKEDPIIIHFHGSKFETPCYKCLLTASTKEEAKEACPKCLSTLWFMYGNPKNLYESVLNYYNKLVFKQVPYYNVSSNNMVVD
eukprot:TRINITY_DN1646_c1_g1_i4.p2 TRINITY_DN1646_c1_g1~~TRINITY_DN1646_c1_g1_i4.p2  ORF type:complete len:337 (-),score=20.95 TRINITY_DN1646_c1_g1_i4:2682-3692(-)